jgi:hypothetical protein
VLSSCQDAESVPGRSAFGPSRPLRRIPVMVSFLTHSGHLAFAAGTALHAPKQTIGDARLLIFDSFRPFTWRRLHRDAFLGSMPEFGCAARAEER